LVLAVAAWLASTLSQPDIEAPVTPAADSRKKSRRDRPQRVSRAIVKFLSSE
jgi:hypothetical protein